MKEKIATVEIPTLPISELEIGGVYFTTKNELVKIKKIDHELKELHTLNIGEQYTMFMPFDRHIISRKVR